MRPLPSLALALLPLPLLLARPIEPAGSPSPAPAPPAAPTASGPMWTGSLGHVVFPAGETVVNLNMQGAYDPMLYGWAVVFDYASITVEADAVVRFTNHDSGAPVIWHSLGDVVIDGTVSLDGESGHGDGSADPVTYAVPGPGGFRGGRGAYYASGSSAGFGPGGGYLDTNSNGDDYGGSGSHAASGQSNGGHSGLPGATYGSASVFPLVGGSGSGAGLWTWGHIAGGGGAGGGAILLASDTSVTLQGQIRCVGGGGGIGTESYGWFSGGRGSGGAIRIVAPSVQALAGSALNALGGTSGHGYTGGPGRIRIETDGPGNRVLAGVVTPEPSLADELFELIPSGAPDLQVVAVDLLDGNGWVDVSAGTADPHARIAPAASADVVVPMSGSVVFQIRARNVPLGETVNVRVVRTRGQAYDYTSEPLGQSYPESTFRESRANVSLSLAGGVSAVQMRVDLAD